jgi:hypothetical protein
MLHPWWVVPTLALANMVGAEYPYVSMMKKNMISITFDKTVIS